MQLNVGDVPKEVTPIKRIHAVAIVLIIMALIMLAAWQVCVVCLGLTSNVISLSPVVWRG